MKRYALALLASSALVGCQSPGGLFGMNGRHNQYAEPTGLAHQTAHKSAPHLASKAHAMNRNVHPKKDGLNPDIVQVGYNKGWGGIQNNNFGQRVAQAIPSHGGQLPGGMEYPGPMPGGAGGCPGGACPPGGMGDGMGGGMPMGPMPGANMMPRFTLGRTQVRFTTPSGMKIGWQAGGDFTEAQLQAPARYNFAQARIYRLKLTDIENRPGLELYPTLEVYPGNAKVDAYLAHNAVPIELNDEDFDQVAGGNFVTKVIYLPDPKFQELAIAGVETLVSTRLDPGIDPVMEAARRGAILAVMRLGGVDLEMPHSPELFQNVPPAPTGEPLSALPKSGTSQPVARANPMTFPQKGVTSISDADEEMILEDVSVEEAQ